MQGKVGHITVNDLALVFIPATVVPENFPVLHAINFVKQYSVSKSHLEHNSFEEKLQNGLLSNLQ